MRSLGIFIFLMSASPVWAAAITNLSNVPQTFSYGWNGRYTVTIPAGQTFRVPWAETFFYEDREVRIEENEEYAIWNDGTFGPQRRWRRNSFGFF